MSKAMKYDRQEAVNKATDLYWEKGFHATSMRNLQDVIDMRPGSIYACFGSKEGLFKEALQNYAHIGQSQLQSCVREASSPLGGLKLFIENCLTNCDEAPSGVCMLVKTVSELTEDNAELLAEAKKLLSGMEAAFTALLVEAQARGELAQSADPSRLASYLQVQLMGLRAYARVNDDQERVRVIVEQIFAGEPFKA